MSFNAIRENEILAKISESTVGATSFGWHVPLPVSWIRALFVNSSLSLQCLNVQVNDSILLIEKLTLTDQFAWIRRLSFHHE